MSDEKIEDKITKSLVPIDKTTGQLAPTDLEGMWRIASIMSTSEMVPSEYRKKPEKCFVAMQLGMEVGLGFMAAIQTICVINGKPAIYGDGVPAIVQSRGKCKKWDEHLTLPKAEGEDEVDRMKHYRGPANLSEWPDELTAVCILEREGFDQPFEGYFSVADAKRMGKWNKPESQGGLSVWQKYPLRMLQMRARGFATRDGFSDHLKGIGIVEDLMDVEPEVVSQPIVEEAPAKTGLDAALETKDGEIVNAEYNEPPEEPASQEEPLSEPEVAKEPEPVAAEEAAKHPLIVYLETGEYNILLIDQFIEWAAKNNEMDILSLMNEAMTDIEGFEQSMVEWGEGEKVEIYAKEIPSPEEAAAIDDSAAACQVALDEAEVPELATEDGVIEQEKDPAKKEDLDPNADIEGWVSRFHRQYRLKNKHQYSPFVLANEVKFRQLFEYSPDVYDKAVEKWTRFYNDEPWPVVLDPERDQVDEEPYLHKGPVVAAQPSEPKTVNEAARIFTNEEEMTHGEKLVKMKELFPEQTKKALDNLKMGSGALSEAAVEVVSFAVKEIIQKEKKKGGK